MKFDDSDACSIPIDATESILAILHGLHPVATSGMSTLDLTKYIPDLEISGTDIGRLRKYIEIRLGVHKKNGSLLHYEAGDIISEVVEKIGSLGIPVVTHNR